MILTLLQLPGYQLIHQGSKFTKPVGLFIYLNENYSYKIRKLYTGSISGKVYSLTSMVVTFVVHLQSATYIDPVRW